MLHAVLKTIHLLCVVAWVGGMFFVLACLRPALAVLEGPQRLRLMQAVLQRFLGVVTVAAGLVLVTGVWMIARVARAASQSGLAFNMPIELHLMAGLGVLMLAIFGHIRFVLYRRLVRALAAQDGAGAAAALGSIRRWVGVNLGLGVAIIVATLLGSAV